MAKTKTFPGGVHPHGAKSLTKDKEIRTTKIPQKVVIPLVQHTGNPAKSLVEKGDSVTKGQLIGEADGFISSGVHASISGKVTALEKFVNPVYGKTLCVFIESDGEDKASADIITRNSIENLTGDEVKTIIKNAGIVGLGGAAFPTHVKVLDTEKKHIDALIINGVECEPYLTCDYRLMIERSKDILDGIELLDKAVSSHNIYISIEGNKPDAIKVMKNALENFRNKDVASKTQIIALKTKYPQGGEKQIIKAILNREVPPGKLPFDVGCLVHNVGTLCAVREAVYEGKPLIERCITITGSCVKNPGNLNVRIGTLLSDIVDEYCDGFIKEPAKIILGGPMMGIAQYTLDIPIIKGVSGVVFLSKEEAELTEESSCIKCAKCVDICPLNLIPTYIPRSLKKGNVPDLKELNVLDCIECGACGFGCPARIPLVQYIKLAKAKVRGLC